jgi:hypothetical protein
MRLTTPPFLVAYIAQLANNINLAHPTMLAKIEPQAKNLP